MNHALILALLLMVQPKETPSYKAGMKAIEQKKYPQAKELLFKALEEGASKEETWYALAFAGQAMGDYQLATDAGKNLSELAPTRGEGWYFQCIGYYKRGVMDSVVPVAKKLMSVNTELAQRANIPKILAMLSQDSVGERDSIFKTPGIKSDSTIAITLPASWSSKHMDDGKTMNWFISLEPVVSDNDLFARGVTVRWIRRLSKTFPLDNNTDAEFLLGFWEAYTERLQSESKPVFKQSKGTSDITSGVWKGVVKTTELQAYVNSPRLTMFEVILARTDEILTIHLECPTDNWPVYEQRFRKALKGMELPK